MSSSRRPESDFWLSPEIAAKAPKDAQPFFQSAQAHRGAVHRGRQVATRSAAPGRALTGVELVSLNGHTPGHTGYEFSSNGQKILFWGRHHPCTDCPAETSRNYSGPLTSTTLRLRRSAISCLPTLASESVMIAGPHMPFPGLGRLRKEGNGYIWAPVGIHRSMGRAIEPTQNCISKKTGLRGFRISQTGHLIDKGEIQNEDHRYRQARKKKRTPEKNTASRKTERTPGLGDVSQSDCSRNLLSSGSAMAGSALRDGSIGVTFKSKLLPPNSFQMSIFALLSRFGFHASASCEKPGGIFN